MFLIRMMTHWFFVKLFSVLAISSIRSSENKSDTVCPEITTDQVKWQITQSSFCTYSNPPCITNRMELSRRCCKTDGTWGSAPECLSTQKTIVNPCPATANYQNNICIFIIRNTTYPPKCPYEETIPFARYVDQIAADIFPIWMPVTRDTINYGIGSFRWVEPTSEYKLPYSNCETASCEYFYEGSLIGKNCLVYHSPTNVKAVSCNETHNAVCAYELLCNRNRSFCSQSHAPSVCRQSDYSTNSKCFCVGSEKTNFTEKAEFLQPYQNLVYQFSTRDVCSIGLKKEGNTYVWSNSNLVINYTNWANDTVFGQEYIFGGISSDGWILSKSQDELSCTLYQKRTIEADDGIRLTYDLNSTLFTLALNDPRSWVHDNRKDQPLVFCFTDAFKEYIIQRIEVSDRYDEHTGTFSFTPSTDGPGNYWCEGFLYPDINVKKSNEYLLRGNTEEYAVILSTNYSKQNNPLTESGVKYFQHLLQYNIDQSSVNTSFYPRVFKVVRLDEELSRITINFHLTTNISSTPMTNYAILRDLMERRLKDFRYESFSFTDTCIGLQSSQNRMPVTWPTTKINEVAARPLEGWCVDGEGAIITRKCGGNFVDGAQWASFNRNCTIISADNITLILTNIVNTNDSKKYIDEVVEISKNYENFNPRDIYLFSQFLEQASAVSSLDVNSIVEILNRIASVSVEILKDSQRVYQATDRILQSVEKLVKISNFTGYIGSSSFAVTAQYYRLQPHHPVAIKLENTTFSILFSNVTETGNTNEAISIILNENLLKSVDPDVELKIVITMYRTSSFFNGIFDERSISMIVSIDIPELNNITESITIYSQNVPETPAACSNWIYEIGKTNGHWYYSGDNGNNSTMVCKFPSLKRFALVNITSRNVTKKLEEISSHAFSMKDSLSWISTLLKIYRSLFKPLDICLVADILNAYSTPEEQEFDLIADIIDGIIDIDEKVLRRALTEHSVSTKSILSNFDNIVENYGKPKRLSKKNFCVLIHPFNGSIISGFRMKACKNYCTIDVIEESNEIPNDVELQIILPSSSVNELIHHSEAFIVVVVFSKTSLFPSEKYFLQKNISKIVGVWYPPNTPIRIEDISIVHKSDNIISQNNSCGIWRELFWNHSQIPTQIDGFQRCHYGELGYSALFWNKVNTTHIMEDILNSDQPLETVLHSLELALQTYHQEFTTSDIPMIAQVFEKVSKVDRNVLRICVNIVDITMTIDRKVLRESQKKFRATDQILYHFGNIAELMEYQPENHIFSSSNIGLTILPLFNLGPTGVKIAECGLACTIEWVWDNSPQKRSIHPAHSKIVLSKELKNAILNSVSAPNKVIVIVFYNDALFNEQKDSRSVSIIFGLRIPKYDDPLEHEVIVYPEVTEYSDGNKCAYWTFSNTVEKIVNASWKIEGPIVNKSTCLFHHMGYFSVIEENALNITAALESILRSSDSIFDKLVRTEGISHFYERFKPVDLQLISLITRDILDLDERILNVIRRMSENFFAISRTVLIQSQIDYDVLNFFLGGINKIGEYLVPNKPFTLRNKLSILVCNLNDSVGIAFNGELICMNSKQSGDPYTSKLVLSKTLIERITIAISAPKIIATVFYNNALFVEEKNVTSSTIFGLYIPFLGTTFDNDISLTYGKGELYQYRHKCAYWEYHKHNYGQWMETNTYEDSQHVNCKFGNIGYYSLLEKCSKNLTQRLQEIESSSISFSEKLNHVRNILVENKDKVEPLHVLIVSKILNGEEVKSEENLVLIGDITSLVMDINRTVLIESQELYNATDWILHRVDTLIAHFQGNINITFKNLALVVRSDLVGLTFHNDKNSWKMKTITSDPIQQVPDDIDALLIIGDDLRDQMLRTSSSINIIVYFNDALFNEKYNITAKNVGIIVGATIPGMSDANLTGNIQILFRNIENRTDICAHWNYRTTGKCIIETSVIETDPVYYNSMSLCQSTVDGTHLALLEVEKNITNELQDILNSTSPIADQLDEVSAIVENEGRNVCPYDIYLIVEIIAKLVKERVVTREQTTLVSTIVSYLFAVQRSVLREAQQQFQATDKMLLYLDEILQKVSCEGNSEPIIKDRFTVTMYDLKNTSIVGFTLNQCTEKSCTVSVLTDSVNITEITENEDFHMGLVLSEELREQIGESSDPVHLVTSIFFEDDFFNEKSKGPYGTSKICGVLFPGLKEPFRGSVSLIYNTKGYEVFDNRSCAFWNYLTEKEKLIGGTWEREITPQENGKIIICKFPHITHFVLLLANTEILDEASIHILDIITNINSVLSLLGVFGIILTAVLFDRWRNNTGNQILINFSLAISIKNVMLYISVGVKSDERSWLACAITGGILHYSILAEFCWMLIIAILQFKRFVEVLGGPLKYVLLKACICGWAFPALPVFLVIIIDVHNYSQGELELCYPSGLWLYLAVWLPLIVIITINSVIFVFILYNVFHNETVTRDQANHEMLFQWRLALLLFFMLGMTWLFGFIGFMSGITVFLVLFCFLATLQGFLMFLFFIVFNKNTRFLYSQGLKRWLYSKGYKNHYT